jgi:hypothetical protein
MIAKWKNESEPFSDIYWQLIIVAASTLEISPPILIKILIIK